MNHVKKFPVDTSLEYSTFLNDKQYDEILYAYLQSIAYPVSGTMAIKKADMPSFQFLASYLNVKTRQTAAARFKKLVEGGYVKYNEELKIYELPLVEKYYYPVAPATLRFLLDTVQERVIKLYLYLGQRFKYKGQGYTFTIQEICQHLGIDYTHSSAIAAHGLELLEKVGLISVQHFYEGYYHRFRLLEFNTQVPLHYDKLTPTE